jgi:hypothetical protein
MGEASPSFLREQAARFRRIAREVGDAEAQRALRELADEYENRAHKAEAADTD